MAVFCAISPKLVALKSNYIKVLEVRLILSARAGGGTDGRTDRQSDIFS